MTLNEMRARVKVGATIACVENTFNAEVSGTRRVVEKAQRNGYWFRHDGKRMFGVLPERASQIITSTDDTVTFRLFPKDPESGHTVTIRFESAAHTGDCVNVR